MGHRVPRTRNGGKWTEAAYWGRLRSALRKAFSHWEPANKAMRRARRPYRGPNKRRKWEYQCADCRQWFKGADVRKDHIAPCGSLRKPEDVWPFIERLTTEDPDDFQILCTGCHRKKTNSER